MISSSTSYTPHSPSALINPNHPNPPQSHSLSSPSSFPTPHPPLASRSHPPYQFPSSNCPPLSTFQYPRSRPSTLDRPKKPPAAHPSGTPAAGCPPYYDPGHHPHLNPPAASHSHPLVHSHPHPIPNHLPSPSGIEPYPQSPYVTHHPTSDQTSFPDQKSKKRRRRRSAVTGTLYHPEEEPDPDQHLLDHLGVTHSPLHTPHSDPDNLSRHTSEVPQSSSLPPNGPLVNRFSTQQHPLQEQNGEYFCNRDDDSHQPSPIPSPPKGPNRLLVKKRRQVSKAFTNGNLTDHLTNSSATDPTKATTPHHRPAQFHNGLEKKFACDWVGCEKVFSRPDHLSKCL